MDDERIKNSDMPGKESILPLDDEQIKNSDVPHQESTGTILLDENDVAQEMTWTDLISHMEHDNGNLQSDENAWQENVHVKVEKHTEKTVCNDLDMQPKFLLKHIKLSNDLIDQMLEIEEKKAKYSTDTIDYDHDSMEDEFQKYWYITLYNG